MMMPSTLLLGEKTDPLSRFKLKLVQTQLNLETQLYLPQYLMNFEATIGLYFILNAWI